MQLNGPVCHIVLNRDCRYLLGRFIDLMAKEQKFASVLSDGRNQQVLSKGEACRGLNAADRMYCVK